MYHAHGERPWSNWNGIWKYHTRLIPAGAAKLLIDQAIACAERHGPTDLLPLGAEFENSGLLNKAFRIVRVFLDPRNDVAKVIAVYSHDGAWHLIVANEKDYLAELAKKFHRDGGPKYPDEYTIESRMRAVY